MSFLPFRRLIHMSWLRSIIILFFAISTQAAIHDAPKSRINSYVVSDLPGLENIEPILIPQMYSGHITLYENNNTNYFFWKFEQKLQNTKSHDSDKLVIWLNGGPGCSSMDGALMEVGPLRLSPDGKVYFNNGTWLESASLVFLDQPVGTGFSYGDVYQNELTDISWDFIVFLQKYFELFPNDLSKDLYLAGESYAGQYIPYFAKYINEHNEKPDSTKFNLKGALIGNGWISPSYTGLSYVPFAIDNGLFNGNEDFMRKILSKQEICQNGLSHLNKESTQKQKNQVYDDCDNILNAILGALHENDENGECVNMYDVRLTDTYPSCGMNWPPDLKYIYPFLSNSDIQAKLNLNSDFIEKEKNDPNNPHRGATYWQECNSRVGNNLRNEHSKSSDEILPEVLSKTSVLLFNGDKDIICNYIGTENFINDLTWNGAKGYSQDLESMSWYYNESNVGLYWQERNLTYVRIFNTSHMVPFDTPDISRGILDLITNNYQLDDIDSDEGSGKQKIIVTPVYDVSSSTYYYYHLFNKARTHFYEQYLHFRYLVYLIILGIIIYGLFHYNAKTPAGSIPHSILTNKLNADNNRPLSGSTILSGIGINTARRPTKKKSVQWADQSDDGGVPLASPIPVYTNYKDDEQPQALSQILSSKLTTANDGNTQQKFNSFLNKFGLSRPFKNKVKYQQTSNYDIEEEIEMADHMDSLPYSSESQRLVSENPFSLDDENDFEVSDEEDFAHSRNH